MISFHFGVDVSTVARVHEAGAKVLCSATTVGEARLLEEAGVDAIIAQGAEAGGHRGTFEGDYRRALVGTLALVPRVVDAVSIPVIAAGGIMDARGIGNRYIEEVEAVDEALLPYPAQYSVSRELRKEAVKHGDPSFMAMWAGQGIGWFRRQPAAEFVSQLVADSQQLINRLAMG